ncbi:MAG: aconitate hydratase AcnA [Gammaproteobacteria bacterium]
MSNSFKARATLDLKGKNYEIFRLDAVKGVARLPFSLKILLENLLRFEDGASVTADDIEALASWDANASPSREIAYRPARVLMQDFTGVPAVVDLAAMRDAMKALGGDPNKINPLSPAELVIDHSVQVDTFRNSNALDLNTRIEFNRNKERYAFLRWGKSAFSNFQVVPPGTGIVHQVNLEYLARVVFTREHGGVTQAYPDTLVGTDSHTTMINGLGVLGWGVGGIEAEAGMLGQPVSMLIPQVVGFRLNGKLSEGATATDLVLTVVEMLRKHGVVGKFVEFFGDGLDNLPLADRATIANMAPEYGATCGIFPVDTETLRYLELSGRPAEQIALVETYARAQGMFRETGSGQADYTATLELNLGDVEPSIAGPKRPQDRVPLKSAQRDFRTAMEKIQHERAAAGNARAMDTGGSAALAAGEAPQTAAAQVSFEGDTFTLADGDVVVAAITSCTNTSNPSVMVTAGLLARKAREHGLNSKPWVKTSLAPGSQVVTDYLKKAGLMDDLEAIGFYLVGYGCTTCIGNSGPLPEPVGNAIKQNDIIATSILSGNRNFEGRIHPLVRMNYLASPPLVVAYALAGTLDYDPYNDSLGEDNSGKPLFLRDIWPSAREIQEVVSGNIDSEMFRQAYGTVYSGDERWNGLEVTESELYDWKAESTYIRKPTFFDGMTKTPGPVAPIENARVLALLGDSVTTDHISPAGAIPVDGPAGQYLQEHGVQAADFNSFGSRRGNHEVMMRGTFGNIRLRNRLAPGTEGGWTVHQPSGEQMSIYDACMRYQQDGVPLVVLVGKEYGTGSSRDWAAKGTILLGVKAVITESFERIHRSNLVGMGVLPLQFKPGESALHHGLDGKEEFTIEELNDGAKELKVTATSADGNSRSFQVQVRIDTPQEMEYYKNGGILHYVLRQLAA